MLVSNMIFPAFHAAYLSWLMLLPLGILVLVAEATILWSFNREANWWAAWVCALVMNFASGLVGVPLAPMLVVGSGFVPFPPGEEESGGYDRGPDWSRLARYSFLQAGIVSAVVEVAVLWPLRRLTQIRRILVPVVLGNLVSYVVLFLGYVLM
jgi:hypothetical protein